MAKSDLNGRVTQPLLGTAWGIHSEWRSSKWTDPGAVRSDQELYFKDKLSPEQPLLLTYPNHTPHKPHNLVIKRVIYSYTTGQGRAEHCPRKTLSNAADRDIWSGWNWSQRMDITGTPCSMRQYSASRCSRPTELYMVCPWKRKDCICSWPVCQLIQKDIHTIIRYT